jgi:hypothetical protein
MRKHLFTLMLVMLSFATFGQQWVAIRSDVPSTIQTTLVSSSENQITVNLQVPGFYAFEVNTPRGEANVISVPKTVSTAAAGEPNLPMIAIPAIIGDQQHYSIRVINAQYSDFQMEVAPSKGDFPRTINPEDVPYTYGEAYSMNAFFPAENVGLYEPYILRDFRGQNMVVYPFAYNPVTHTLRVYYNMTVEMFSDGQQGENTLSRRSNTVKMDAEFGALYDNHFINYHESLNRYTPVDETGELLIICHDAFMSAMQPFVNWKKQIGRPTTMVGTSTAGSTSDALKTYIQTQYNNNPNITHILLVGDHAQIQGYYAYNGGYSGRSDNWYGQLVGNDYYNDVIVGRFSAENDAHVTTQVNKVIHYERDITASDTWLPIGQGVSKNEGAGSGHYGEADYQHIDNIRNDLLAYNYTTVHRDYQGVSGVTSSAAIISQHINEGVSIINYTNHGSETSWGVFNYSNSHVNALTNDNKLPVIWSVACLNGKYDHNQPCFAEAWLRATDNTTGEPTGAIGGMFSYISQPWQPPMYGHDEMVDVLVESYSNNIKRTFGGCSFDGNMKIIDQYGSNNSSGMGTYMTWILFGDPTLTLRNAIPANMNVTHAPSMTTSATSFTVNATNGNGALATLTRNNEIMGSATINNGTANITFTAPGTTGTATLTVFGYNKITYIATINITQGSGPEPINMSVSANPTVIAQGGNSQLNAIATGGDGSFTYNWTPAASLNDPHAQNPRATPNTTTTYTCTVSSGGLTASGTCIVTVVNAPNNLTANVQNNSNVVLNWTAANPAQSYKVYRNNTMIAQGITSTTYTDSNLSAGTYSYQVSTMYQGIESPRSNTATATITAPLSVTVTASETVINPGSPVTLSAQPTGGSGTYTYSWSPANAVNNPTAQSTTASPEMTTTYTCTVTCNGQSASGSVTVIAVTPPAEMNAEIVDDEEVYITWSEAEVADYYNLYRSGVLIADHLTVTNYTDNYAFWGDVCYEVRAIYQDVYSEAATDCVFFCAPPIMVEAEYIWDDGDFFTRISWRKEVYVNTEVDKFRVFRNRLEDSEFELIGEVENEDYVYDYHFDDTTATVGAYEYYVSATYTYYECEMASEVVSCEVTSVTESDVAVKVYPNPTQGEITLEGEGISHVRIVNAYGQTVYNAKVESEHVRIDLSQMAKGIYMMHIEADCGQAVRKIVVE